MNYLQLVNNFLVETEMDDPIATVTGQYDDPLKATVWISDAWLEIQRSRNDWTFRWAEGNFDTIASQREYVLADIGLTNSDKLDFETFKIIALKHVLVESNYRTFTFSSDEGLPRHIYQKPNGTLGMYFIPDAVYQLDFEYHAAPVTLAADSDTPSLDEEYHKAIVWLAIRNYAREQGNEWKGLYQSSSIEYSNIHRDMINNFLKPYAGKKGL